MANIILESEENFQTQLLKSICEDNSIEMLEKKQMNIESQEKRK